MIDTLPAESQSAHAAIPAPRPATQNPIIMVVGTNEDTRCMLRVILELWDYEVIEARTSEESLTLGRDRKPAVVLIDSSVHFHDSLDDLSKLRHSEDLGDTPSLIISGFSQDVYREGAMDSGASGFLVKPIDFDLLRQHIEMLVTQSHGH